MAFISLKEAKRFWSHVSVPNNLDDCWDWQASTCGNGYGRVKLHKKFRATHRIAYALAKGIDYEKIPSHKVIRHTCDNRPCCNPAHLLLGTHLENAQDRVTRNRSPSQKGEANYCAGLTENQVREIRSLYAAGTHTQIQLAAQYGTTNTNVSLIVLDKRWTHI